MVSKWEGGCCPRGSAGRVQGPLSPSTAPRAGLFPHPPSGPAYNLLPPTQTAACLGFPKLSSRPLGPPNHPLLLEPLAPRSHGWVSTPPSAPRDGQCLTLFSLNNSWASDSQGGQRRGYRIEMTVPKWNAELTGTERCLHAGPNRRPLSQIKLQEEAVTITPFNRWGS